MTLTLEEQARMRETVALILTLIALAMGFPVVHTLLAFGLLLGMSHWILVEAV